MKSPRSLPPLGAFGLCATLTALALFLPSSGSSQNVQANGTWQLRGSVQDAQRRVQEAVEPAVRSLDPDTERMARARIAESTWVPQTITINASASRIQTTFQGSESRTFDTQAGQPRNVYSRSGVRASLVQSIRPDGGIEQRFQAMDGTQYNLLTPSGNDLRLDVMMQSRRLHGEIRFHLEYQRR